MACFTASSPLDADPSGRRGEGRGYRREVNVGVKVKYRQRNHAFLYYAIPYIRTRSSTRQRTGRNELFSGDLIFHHVAIDSRETPRLEKVYGLKNGLWPKSGIPAHFWVKISYILKPSKNRASRAVFCPWKSINKSAPEYSVWPPKPGLFCFLEGIA